MANVDLRPLSLGEILDRTFSLYRRHFAFFLGISALPYLLALGLGLLQTLALPRIGGGRQFPNLSGGVYAGAGFWLITIVVQFLAYILSQGGTVFGVSEIYLGNQTTIRESFGRMVGEFANLFGVLVLWVLFAFGAPLVCFGAAIVFKAPGFVFLAFVLILFPGFYLACRLMVCVPAALLENIGPRSSLERSFSLTKGNVGRAFLIYLLYIVLAWAAASLLTWPFTAGFAAAKNDPQMVRVWLSLTQVGSFVAKVLVAPILTIASAVYYYDLRVRKEAFDLQFMMYPGGVAPARTAGVPTMLS